MNELIRAGGSWSGKERNVAYRNEGDGRFEDVSYVTGLDFDGDGRAMAAFDYDHDGRMDMVLTFRTGPRLRLLHNGDAGGRQSLQLELQGEKSNRDAVGAWVTLRTNRRALHRQVHSGSGFLSQSSRRLHFGLLEGEVPGRIEIAWPSGLAQTLDELPPQGLYRVVEGRGLSPLAAKPVVLPVTPEREAESLWLKDAVPAPEAVPTKGKLTLVSFFADWCPPCKAELAEWKGQGLPLHVIDVDHAPMAAWNVFRRLLFDFREDLALPTSLLLNNQGKVIKVYRGATPARTIRADMLAAARPVLPFAGVWLAKPQSRNYGELAVAMAEAGLPRQAGEYFRRAKPDEEVRVNYAALLLEQKQFKAAEPILREVLRSRPNHADALANLGLLLLAEERYAEAAGPLERLRTLQPGDGAGAEWLGLARLGEGRPAEAKGLFEEARKLGRESADLLNHLAILYAEEGRTAEAVVLFRYGLERYPDHPGLKANLARLTH